MSDERVNLGILFGEMDCANCQIGQHEACLIQAEAKSRGIWVPGRERFFCSAFIRGACHCGREDT